MNLNKLTLAKSCQKLTFCLTDRESKPVNRIQRSMKKDFTEMNNQYPSIKMLKRTQTIIVPLQRIEEHIKIYNWRNSSLASIVKCKWISILPVNEKQVKFELQISQLNTFNQIGIIQEQKLFEVLQKILKGFQTLFEEFGSFDITSEMIGFDKESNPFVWMNAQFWKNEHSRNFNSEASFILNLLEVLNKNRINFGGSFFSDIIAKLKNTGKFNEALEALCDLQIEKINKIKFAHSFLQISQKTEFQTNTQQSILSFRKSKKPKQSKIMQKQQIPTLPIQVHQSCYQNGEQIFQQKKRRNSISELQTYFNYPKNANEDLIADQAIEEMHHSVSQKHILKELQNPSLNSFLRENRIKQMHMSIDFGDDTYAKELVEIQCQKLDKFKRNIAVSIITDQY